MITTLPTQCDDSKLAMAMDDMGYPHCVWTDGSHIRYARFYGDSWRTAGDSAIAVSGSNLAVSRHCICFNGSGNCVFAYMEGLDLKVASWDGLLWTSYTLWANAGSNDVLAWSLAWASAPVAVAITRNAGNRTIYAIDNVNVPVGVLIPSQDNDALELKASAVSTFVYAFWTGHNNTEESDWIGHAIWDYSGQAWVYRPAKLVAMSVAEASISGLDFVPTNQVAPAFPVIFA